MLVRHGETELNAAGRYSGWGDTSLTSVGIEQAVEIGRRLDHHRVDSVVSSDLHRAVETARRAGFAPRLDSRWRELDFGSIEGRRFDQCDEATRAALVQFDSFAAPGGESTSDLARRVDEALDELRSGHHIVFTHGGPIRHVIRSVGHDRVIKPGQVLGLQTTPKGLWRISDPA